MQKQGKRKVSIFAFLCMMTVLFLWIPGKEAKAADADAQLKSISVYYSGGPVLVGNFIDLEKLTVKGYYSNGKYVELKDYSLSEYVIEKEGYNVVTVYCDDVSTTFTVRGRSVKRVSAYYTQSSVTIGEFLDPEKLTVYVTFNDGTMEKTTEFDLPDTLVTEIGKNEFTVIYQDKSATFYVTGKEERKVRSIYASYNGQAVIVGNEPAKKDFYVTAIYNDGTVEKLTDFTLTPRVVEEEGSNILQVSYAGLTADVRVQGRAKRVLSITAEYTGLPVVVGKPVAMDDIKVIATFNDETKGEVTSFSLSNPIIEKIGDNLVTVVCDGKITRVTVRGIECEVIDYSHGLKATVRDGGFSSRVSIAVGAKADPEQVDIEKVSRQSVKKAMNRLVKTDKYLAYEVSFSDPEQDAFLPMTMKVSVPTMFDRENFAVYYTPNRKTIMAQMNGEFLEDGTYEFKMFQPGTYIIADCTPLIYVETLMFEEGEELTMRLGRSYSLDPVILPHAATNKEVEYESSRSHIVTVDKYGTLTALKTGQSVITVEAKDGSGKKCTLRVIVVK